MIEPESELEQESETKTLTIRDKFMDPDTDAETEEETIIIQNTLTETHKVIIKFLQQSFEPVRLTFPKQAMCYKNGIFSCYNHGILHEKQTQMRFEQGIINTPAMAIARLLIEYDNYVFDLEEIGDNYILDTMGRIPTRYCYMLKDFYFKDQKTTIDFCSKKSIDSMKEFWSETVSKCPLTILKNIAMIGFRAAEWQSYRIQVLEGPGYFKNREWFTKDHNHSEAAKEAWERSKKLYSLGNIDPDAKNKHQYYKLYAAEGGIKMSYANFLPWQAVRSHIRYGPFTFDHYVSSCGYTDTRGHDTYDQRKDLSVEEIVILYEYLKSEGANVKVISTATRYYD